MKLGFVPEAARGAVSGCGMGLGVEKLLLGHML